MLSKSAQSIQNTLSEKNLSAEVVELPASTRSAKEAGEAIGCVVAQIVKSLIFRTKETKKPILILASGVNQVNEKTVAKLIGEKIERADPNFVREVTGFAIGGIPPVGHKQPIETFIDEDLLQFETVWAAAGTPHAVFSLQSVNLQNLTGGKVTSIK